MLINALIVSISLSLSGLLPQFAIPITRLYNTLGVCFKAAKCLNSNETNTENNLNKEMLS